MRLRNVKGSKEFIDASPYVVHEPEAYKGIWREKLFNNRNPLHIEIGMGKGQFIHQLAEKNPDINYIGIEMYSSVLYRALERREQTELNNLFFIRFDAKYLLDIFDQEEVDRIYLNFSDPWPKDRHARGVLRAPTFCHCIILFWQKKAISSLKLTTGLFLIFPLNSRRKQLVAY